MLQSKKDLTLYQEIIDNQEFARSEIGRLSIINLTKNLKQGNL